MTDVLQKTSCAAARRQPSVDRARLGSGGREEDGLGLRLRELPGQGNLK